MTNHFWKEVGQWHNPVKLIATFPMQMMKATLMTSAWIWILFLRYQIMQIFFPIHPMWPAWNVLYHKYCQHNPCSLVHHSGSSLCYPHRLFYLSKDSCRNALKTSNWNNVQRLPLPSISWKAGPDQEGRPDTESSQSSLPAHEDIKVYKDADKQSKSVPQFQSERSLSAAVDDLIEKLESPKLIQDSTLLAPTHALPTDQSSKISVDLHDKSQITSSDTSFIESSWKSSTQVPDDLILNRADHSLLTNCFVDYYSSDDPHHHPVQPFVHLHQEEVIRDPHPNHSVVVPLSSSELLVYPVDTSSPQRTHSLNTTENNDTHSAALDELLPSTDTTRAMLNQTSRRSESPTKNGSSDKADSTSKNGIWCTTNNLSNRLLELQYTLWLPQSHQFHPMPGC